MKRDIVYAVALGLLSSILCAQTYNISTVAGSVKNANGDGVNANLTPLLNPHGIVIDSAGNIYIADADAHRVRKIDAATQVMTVIAGQGRASGSGDAAGPGASSPLNDPMALAVSPDSKILYIAERDNHKVKALDLTTGVLTTFVGYAGRAGWAGDGESALYARIRNPMGVATDSAGNVYILDRGNNRIRKVTLKPTTCRDIDKDKDGKCQPIITTVAGIGPVNADPAYLAQSNGDGGPAILAQLARPEGLAVDSSGNIFIADTNNNKIRKVDASTGIITTVVGTCVPGANISGGSVPAFLPVGFPWPTCGPGTQATAASPAAVGSGTTKQTALVTFIDNVPGVDATLNAPRGLAFDAAGNLYIADTGTNRVRVLNASTGIVSTLAGCGPSPRADGCAGGVANVSSGFAGDGGPSNRALLSGPRGVAIAPNGDVYITDQTQGLISTDSANGKLRVVESASGTIRTVNANLYQGDGGASTNAVFNDPRGVAVDAAGNIYVTDSSNQRIRKITASDGTIATVAGRGVTGSANDTAAAPALTSTLNFPNCTAVDAANSLYIADRSNNRVRKVDAYGNITTIAGGGSNTVAPSGTLATSVSLSGPRCVALDNLGNLYIADSGNNAVRKVDPNGIITTVAGVFVQSPIPSASGTWVGTNGPQFLGINQSGFSRRTTNTPNGDGGPGTSAYLNNPHGIAVDPQGTRLYIADTDNHAVRVVNLNTGVITLVAGGYTDGSSDGAPSGLTVPAGSIGTGELTRLQSPTAVAADAAGNIYIADHTNYRVLRVDKDGNVYVIAGGASAGWGDNKAATSVSVTFPRGIAVDLAGNVYFTEPLGLVRKLTPSK